jgi:hypothetical protein
LPGLKRNFSVSVAPPREHYGALAGGRPGSTEPSLSLVDPDAADGVVQCALSGLASSGKTGPVSNTFNACTLPWRIWPWGITLTHGDTDVTPECSVEFGVQLALSIPPGAEYPLPASSAVAPKDL